MLDKLKTIELRYQEVEERLADNATYADPALAARLNQEQRELQPLMETYRAYLQAHAGAALELLLPEAGGLPLLLSLARPDREALSAACRRARELGATAALAVLLEARHRLGPERPEKRFEL